MPDPRDLIDAEIESFAREWDGPLPNGLLNSLGDRLHTALAADPLVEALESDRLRAALAGVMAVTYSADDVRLLAVGFAGSKVGDDVHAKYDRMKAAHDVVCGAVPCPNLHCLGTNTDGSPKHPLARGRHRVPREQRPILYRRGAGNETRAEVSAWIHQGAEPWSDW